jgi:GT2 family glycosyltransferase
MGIYNAMPFLAEAVESVLAQSYSDFEFLIIDDGSTDDSCAYLESVRDHRLRFVRRRHEGVGATLNAGLALCDTEFIAYMDGDDVIHPRRLEMQLEYLAQNPQVSIVGCQVEFFVNAPTGLIAPVPTEHDEIFKRLLAAKSGISHATMMMRASVIQLAAGYKIAIPGTDVDFCIRLCEVGRAANLPDVYYYYRLHRRSISVSHRPEAQMTHAYALKSAECRRDGQTEPDFEAFLRQWKQRNSIRKLSDRLGGWATLEYRLSIIDRAEGRQLLGHLRLLGAAMAQPHWCVWHLRRLARDWFRWSNRAPGIASHSIER